MHEGGRCIERQIADRIRLLLMYFKLNKWSCRFLLRGVLCGCGCDVDV